MLVRYGKLQLRSRRRKSAMHVERDAARSFRRDERIFDFACVKSFVGALKGVGVKNFVGALKIVGVKYFRRRVEICRREKILSAR